MRATTGLGLLLMIEVVGTAAVVLMVILPLATGGFSPDRKDFVPAILISLGVAFLSTCVLVLTLFDIPRFERSELPDPNLGQAMARLRRGRHDGAAKDVDPSDEPSSDESG